MTLIRNTALGVLLGVGLCVLVVSCGGGKEEGDWSVVGRMGQARMAAGAVVSDGSLIVIGGATGGGYVADCEWSRFGDDGELVSWRMAPSLTTPRGYVAAVLYDGNVYALGGANGERGEKLLNTVERAPLNPDGTPGHWSVEASKMVSSRRGGTAFAHKGYLYAVGGFNGEFLDTVERAPVSPDGTLGEWDITSVMLERRYIHASVLVGDRVYVIGGHERSTGGALSSVEFAGIDGEGELGEWVETSPLVAARYGAYAVESGGYIFVVGGYDGSSIAEVERARINPDGTLGEWQVVSKTAMARNSPVALIRDGRIYVLGGAETGSRYLASVESVVVGEGGELERWERK